MDKDMNKGKMGVVKQRAFINLISIVDIGGSGTIGDIVDNIYRKKFNHEFTAARLIQA